ncbi:RloB family protein [Pediococcus parvulus]|uniref:Abortive phage resistance protein n=1 Tax=Pediococcus parvulus TaxID=54062 RepID=A0AAP5WDB5_9LACO|nr:RloB family protein [Pediococcus parvulus]MDV7693979.1 hypothetical protein [Pediococcus parvulus]OAD63408.1 hypothetical protein A7K95_09710 [Pediococcus parvulus]
MSRRRTNRKNIKNQKLVFYEGETEVHYFNMLKQRYNGGNIKIKLINSHGQKGTKLLQEAIKWRKSNSSSLSQLYICFDNDHQPTDLLINTLKLAESENIRIIYSNICFEVWLLLHFHKIENETNWLNSEWLYLNFGNILGLENYEKSKGQDLSSYFEDRILTADRNCQNYTHNHNLTNSVFYKNLPYTNLNQEIRHIFQTIQL